MVTLSYDFEKMAENIKKAARQSLQEEVDKLKAQL